MWGGAVGLDLNFSITSLHNVAGALSDIQSKAGEERLNFLLVKLNLFSKITPENAE